MKKIPAYIFLLLFLLLMHAVNPHPTLAIVIITPLMTVSVLKLSALLVSVLAVPVTAFFQIIKRNRLKALLIALVSLSIIFVIVYGSLTLIFGGIISRYSQQRQVLPDEGMTYEDHQKLLVPDLSDQPVTEILPADTQNIAFIFILFTLLFLILALPCWATIFLIDKLSSNQINPVKVILLGLLLDLIVTTLFTFVITLIVLISSNQIAVQ